MPQVLKIDIRDGAGPATEVLWFALKYLQSGASLKIAFGPSAEGGAVLLAKTGDAGVTQRLRDVASSETPRFAVTVTRQPLIRVTRRLIDLQVGDEADHRSRYLRADDRWPIVLNGPAVVPAVHVLHGLANWLAAKGLTAFIKHRFNLAARIAVHDKGLLGINPKSSPVATTIRRSRRDLVEIAIRKDAATPLQRRYALKAIAHARQTTYDNSVPGILRDSVMTQWAEGLPVWQVEIRMTRGLFTAFERSVGHIAFQAAEAGTEWQRQLRREEAELAAFPSLYTLNESMSVLKPLLQAPAA